VLDGTGAPPGGCQTTIGVSTLNTHFNQATTTIAALAPATASGISITVNTPTSLTVTLTAAGTIGTNFNFTITTGAEVVTVTGYLTFGAC
jgi:hypothetical protein